MDSSRKNLLVASGVVIAILLLVSGYGIKVSASISPSDSNPINRFFASIGSLFSFLAKPSPVGKWTGTVSGMTGSTIEFTVDNKVKQTASSPMGAVDAEGTYKVNGDKLDIAITSVKMGGKDMMSMLPAQVKSNLNQSVTWAIKEGNLELVGSGGPTTLTPVK